jgi:hypothetical protein
MKGVYMMRKYFLLCVLGFVFANISWSQSFFPNPNSTKTKSLGHEDSLQLIKYLRENGKATPHDFGEGSSYNVKNMKCEFASGEGSNKKEPACKFTDASPKTPQNLSLEKKEAAEVIKLIEKCGIKSSDDGQSITASTITCACGGFTGQCSCTITP